MLKIFDRKTFQSASIDFEGSLSRNIVITNVVSVIFTAALVIIYGFIFLYIEYLQPVSWVFVPLIFFFLLPIALNQVGFYTLSRLVLSCLPSLGILFFSIYAKLKVTDLTFNDFYNFRIGLVALCTIPFLLFSLYERSLLIGTAIICFSCLALSDYVHHLFNVGFYDIGFTDSHYDFINFPTIIAALAIMSGIVTLKQIIEKQERENNGLVASLQQTNQQIASQRDKLIDQQLLINNKQVELSKAYKLIEDQKKWLEEELAIYDYEVTQFSYSVCHHLRGPVASLSGLVNILDMHDGLPKEILVAHFKKSVNHLEGVVSDLNYILQIRKDTFRSKSMLSVEKLLSGTNRLLEKEMNVINPAIDLQINVQFIYASYSAFENVLYNLLSNSFKYRAEDRPLQIFISTNLNANKSKIEIVVRDNGLGIDLERFNSDIFKMYKRFHLHKEGKGLGLYLTKLQVNAMGGEITVNSKVDCYTEFVIVLPIKEADETIHY
jgi:signal transduction histidine kinase